MVRPRGGNFTYDAHELAIIKKDILICRDLGCTGIAAGVLLPDGSIDTEQMKRIVEWAHPMAVTCHKAFDRTHDALASLEALITTGCARVLTSGLQPTATDGAALLSQLLKQAAAHIIIMPGGGVRSTNIAQLVSQTGAAEYHSSGIISKDGNYMADLNEVRSMTQLLNSSITQ
jgi:copper homeostasis protein